MKVVKDHVKSIAFAFQIQLESLYIIIIMKSKCFRLLRRQKFNVSMSYTGLKENKIWVKMIILYASHSCVVNFKHIPRKS